MSAFTHVHVYMYVHVLHSDGVLEVRASECDVELFHLHIYIYTHVHIHERIFICIHLLTCAYIWY